MPKKSIRARLLVAAAAVLAACVWLSLPWVVRRAVQKKAEARGMRAEVEKVRIGFWSVELEGVTVYPDGGPVKPFRVRKVSVLLSVGFGVQKVEVEGADIEATGTIQDLRSAFRGKEGGVPATGKALEASATGISVSWTGPCGDGSRATATGVTAYLGTSGWSAEAGRVEASCMGVEASLTSVSASAESARAESLTAKWHGFTATAGGLKFGRGERTAWLETESSVVSAYGATVVSGPAGVSVDVDGKSVTVRVNKAQLSSPGILDGLSAAGIEAKIGLEADSMAARIRVSVEEVSGSHPAVAGQGVSAHAVSAEGLLVWSHDRDRAVLFPVMAEAWTVSVGGASVTASGAAYSNGDFEAEVNLGQRMQKCRCSSVIAAIPDGMAPVLAGFEADAGVVSANLKVTRYGQKVDVKADFGYDCKFTKWPAWASKEALKKPFKRWAYGPDGSPIEVASGPGTLGWTPIGFMSESLPKAVIASEDPGFMRHRGFEPSAVANSLKKDLEEGRFARGGSTITMQLAKNLWLTRSKTVSRKVQEAFLTMYLEQTLSKREILEVYLNVAEFAPAQYGAAAGAEAYFSESPGELTLAQSLFMASMLPRPKGEGLKADGMPSPSKILRLRSVMEGMGKSGSVSAVELQEALDGWPFNKATEDGPAIALPGGLDPDWDAP